MEMLIFYIVLVHELSPLIKYVIHQTGLVVNSKDTKARHLAGKPTCDDESSRTCVHWVTPWGGEGERGGRLPRPYLMSGCLTLWGKLHHLSLFIYTKFQGNLLVFDGQVTFDLYTLASYTPKYNVYIVF